jgi:dUTP pyrophosphatase
MSSLCIPIRKLSPLAVIPRQGTDGAAGFDLFASQGGSVAYGEVALVPTGLAMVIPRGWYGRIAPRSGLAVRHGVDVLAGVIDADYRGEIKVALTVLRCGEEFQWQSGDRVAQLILEQCARVCWDVDGPVQDWEGSQRGAGGFGSTGQ